MKSVQLLRRCKTPDGWKRLPVVYGKNGKVRPGFAVYQGMEVQIPGTYQLRTSVKGRTVWTSVGDDAAKAVAARSQMMNRQRVQELAKDAGVTIAEIAPQRLALEARMKAYLSRLEAQGKLTTIEAGGYAIREFIAISGATFADEVTEDTILRWYNALRRKGNSDRTRFNKHTYLFTFFRWMKLDTKSLAEHPPDFTEREVSIYSPEELKALFASLPEGGLKLAFETLLQAGLRETELTHLTWERVDFAARRILVREYDQEGAMVRIKDRDERSVPISIELAAKLAAWKLARPGTNLVFGTKGDLPDGKLLRALKRAANRAGLECGRCPGCRSKTKECRRWTLKRFRSTCTTTLLRSGLDVRTVMSIMGHADLETTMKYLAVANQDSTLSKIDQIAWT